MLRRIRGAIGMGLVWAFVCSAAGAVPRWIFGINTDAPIPILFGAFGFVAGVVFSAVLILAERRRSFDEMSLPRFAGWGAVGGLLLSALWAKTIALGWGDILMVVPSFTVASALCASSSLALARRAPRPELRSGDGKP